MPGQKKNNMYNLLSNEQDDNDEMPMSIPHKPVDFMGYAGIADVKTKKKHRTAHT